MARYSYNIMGKTLLAYLLGRKKHIELAEKHRSAIPKNWDEFFVKNCCPAASDSDVEIAYDSLSKEGEAASEIAKAVEFLLQENKSVASETFYDNVIQKAETFLNKYKEEIENQINLNVQTRSAHPTPRGNPAPLFAFPEKKEKILLRQPSQKKYEIGYGEHYQVAGEIILPLLLQSGEFKKLIAAILISMKPTLSKQLYNDLVSLKDHFYPQSLSNTRVEFTLTTFVRPVEAPKHAPNFLNERLDAVNLLTELEKFLSRKILRRILNEPINNLFISPLTRFFQLTIQHASESKTVESKVSQTPNVESTTRIEEFPSARAPARPRRLTPNRSRPTTPSVAESTKTQVDEAPKYRYTPLYEPRKFSSPPTRANTIGWSGLWYIPDAIGEIIYLLGVHICRAGNATRNLILSPAFKLANWANKKDSTAGKIASGIAFFFLGIICAIPETIKWSLALPLFCVKMVTFTLAKLTSGIGRLFSFCFSKNKSLKSSHSSSTDSSLSTSNSHSQMKVRITSPQNIVRINCAPKRGSLRKLHDDAKKNDDAIERKKSIANLNRRRGDDIETSQSKSQSEKKSEGPATSSPPKSRRRRKTPKVIPFYDAQGQRLAPIAGSVDFSHQNRTFLPNSPAEEGILNPAPPTSSQHDDKTIELVQLPPASTIVTAPSLRRTATVVPGLRLFSARTSSSGTVENAQDNDHRPGIT